MIRGNEVPSLEIVLFDPHPEGITSGLSYRISRMSTPSIPRSTRRFRFVAGVLAASSLAFAACGGGDSGPADTVPADTQLVVTAVPSIRFDAESYEATAGEISVGYINEDSVRHTLIVVKDGEKVPNFKLEIGKKGDVDYGSITLEAGNYVLFCDVPGHQNMKAELTVK
jgi:plastocyanin